MKTKIVFENENAEHSVVVDDCEMDLDDVKTKLIVPVLLAAGYSMESLCKAFDI